MSWPHAGVTSRGERTECILGRASPQGLGQQLTSSRRSMLAFRQGVQDRSSLFSSSSCCNLGHKNTSGMVFLNVPSLKCASKGQGRPRYGGILSHWELFCDPR